MATTGNTAASTPAASVVPAPAPSTSSAEAMKPKDSASPSTTPSIPIPKPMPNATESIPFSPEYVAISPAPASWNGTPISMASEAVRKLAAQRSPSPLSLRHRIVKEPSKEAGKAATDNATEPKPNPKLNSNPTASLNVTPKESESTVKSNPNPSPSPTSAVPATVHSNVSPKVNTPTLSLNTNTKPAAPASASSAAAPKEQPDNELDGEYVTDMSGCGGEQTPTHAQQPTTAVLTPTACAAKVVPTASPAGEAAQMVKADTAGAKQSSTDTAPATVAPQATSASATASGSAQIPPSVKVTQTPHTPPHLRAAAKAPTPSAPIAPGSFKVNSAVEALWTNGKWYRAYVTHARADGTYRVVYADGVVADSQPAKAMRQSDQPSDFPAEAAVGFVGGFFIAMLVCLLIGTALRPKAVHKTELTFEWNHKSFFNHTLTPKEERDLNVWLKPNPAQRPYDFRMTKVEPTPNGWVWIVTASNATDVDPHNSNAEFTDAETVALWRAWAHCTGEEGTARLVLDTGSGESGTADVVLASAKEVVRQTAKQMQDLKKAIKAGLPVEWV